MQLADFPLNPVELLLLAEFGPGPMLAKLSGNAELFAVLDARLQLGQPQGEFGAVALIGGIGVLAVELAAVEPARKPSSAPRRHDGSLP